MFDRQISESDVLLQGNGRRAACDLTDLAAVDENGIVIAGNITAEHFEAD
jgi:hypothetical protein